MNIRRLTAAALITLSLGGCKSAEKKTTEEQTPEEQVEQTQATEQQSAEAQPQEPASMSEEPEFDIITSQGTIRVRLYSETPKHRDNFCKLAMSGFYNGLQFHRIIKGFMIQTGDPLSKVDSLRDRWGTGGPGYQIAAEILPQFTHKKGALAAARRGDTANPMRESSGSQFYIVQDPVACSHLDGSYTVFGETISGLGVIDRIADAPVDERDRPLKPVKIISVKYVAPKVEEASTETGNNINQ